MILDAEWPVVTMKLADVLEFVLVVFVYSCW